MPPPPPYSPQPGPPGYVPYQQPANYRYASYGKRVGGHLLNGLVGLLFALPAIAAVFVAPRETRVCTVNDEARLCEWPTGSSWAIIIALGVIGLVAYFVLYSRMVSSSGQAWGHKAAGVRIVDANTGGNIGAWKAFFRYVVGHWIDGAICYIGYLSPLWDSRNQTWGDKVFSTYSVEV